MLNYAEKIKKKKVKATERCNKQGARFLSAVSHVLTDTKKYTFVPNTRNLKRNASVIVSLYYLARIVHSNPEKVDRRTRYSPPPCTAFDFQQQRGKAECALYDRYSYMHTMESGLNRFWFQWLRVISLISLQRASPYL